jgi:RNA polymerase sigma-70 factor, ECF subfamily
MEPRNTRPLTSVSSCMQEESTLPHQSRAEPGRTSTGPPARDLLSRARAGDSDALNELCQQNWLPVYRAVSRWASTSAEAEDLTQDVFVRAIQSIGSYRGVDPALGYRAYLLRISRNLAIDRWRQRQAAGGPGFPVLSDAGLAQRPDAGSGPEDMVIGRDECGRLLAALDRLPDAYSDVLRQRVLLGRTAAEVGALTGQTANAVRQLQFRAMAALRRELTAVQDGEGR